MTNRAILATLVVAAVVIVLGLMAWGLIDTIMDVPVGGYRGTN